MSDIERATDDEDDDLTRRAWLLRLGELTALAGVAGVVPNLAGATTLLGGTSIVGLPAGLYEPSAEHLGLVLSARDAPIVHHGSATAYAAPRRPRVQPSFFSAGELDVVTRFVGVLLGRVDAHALAETVAWIDLRLLSDRGVRHAARTLDPLHRALAVAYYGQARVDELETGDAQDVVRTGLKSMEQHARARFGRGCAALSAIEQNDLVRDISRMPPESPLGRCYQFLRHEAIRGYFTSQAGLQELDYKGNAFYAACPGCESIR